MKKRRLRLVLVKPRHITHAQARRHRERYKATAQQVANRMLDMAEALLVDRQAQSMDTVVRDYVSEAVRRLVEMAMRVGYDGDYIGHTFDHGTDPRRSLRGAVEEYAAWAAFGAAAYLDAHGFNLRFLDERMRTTIGWTEKDGWTLEEWRRNGEPSCGPSYANLVPLKKGRTFRVKLTA